MASFEKKTYSKLNKFLILFPKHDTNELKTYQDLIINSPIELTNISL